MNYYENVVCAVASNANRDKRRNVSSYTRIGYKIELTFERISDESHAHIRVSASQCSPRYVLRLFDDSARLNASAAAARLVIPLKSSSSVICDVSRRASQVLDEGDREEEIE
ncbi:uncharacterized protein LOC143149897 isoform X1 [Ptiloglossa arizonensis]|uniref:uncharacterized protein LOC143149897 isoform X1 n=1 Tax=Ptiloglossa arizonensis TaxID=3350558 RepID=UPI003F9FFE6E